MHLDCPLVAVRAVTLKTSPCPVDADVFQWVTIPQRLLVKKTIVALDCCNLSTLPHTQLDEMSSAGIFGD